MTCYALTLRDTTSGSNEITVTLNAGYALEAIGKAKRMWPNYKELVSCEILKFNY